MIIPGVKKIAILRANAIGDFMVTLPAIYAIRASYPKAELILLGRPWHAQFLSAGRTPIDRVIVVPVANGIREERGVLEDKNELEHFFEAMKKEQFDIAIHFQGKGIASNRFINRLEAKVTAGIHSEGAENIDLSIAYYYYQSEPIRYLEVAALIGARPIYIDPVIHLQEEDDVEATRLINELSIQKFVAIHPCGTDIRRMWPPGRFAETADLLSGKGLDVVFTGVSEDVEYIDGVLSKMNCKAYSVAGKLSLPGLASFFKKSAVVISVDTGPLHLARYAGSKTVGLYWAPNLINWGPLLRDKHRPVISWKMECPNCGIIPNDPFPFEPATNNCNHACSFIESITPDDVVMQVESLI